jgi:hypothetical protein
VGPRAEGRRRGRGRLEKRRTKFFS